MNVTRKVAAGGLGGAVSVIVISVLGSVHVNVDPALASAITTVVTFLISYFVPNADSGVPVGKDP